MGVSLLLLGLSLLLGFLQGEPVQGLWKDLGHWGWVLCALVGQGEVRSKAPGPNLNLRRSPSSPPRPTVFPPSLPPLSDVSSTSVTAFSFLLSPLFPLLLHLLPTSVLIRYSPVPQAFLPRALHLRKREQRSFFVGGEGSGGRPEGLGRSVTGHVRGLAELRCRT